MRSDIAPGAIFPDYELSDHTAKRRKLSELQGQHPLVLVLSRGGFCPKDRRQAEGLVALHRELEVGYCRLVTISTDNITETNEYRTGVGAHWPFLSDVRRIVQKDLDIAEYTDPAHNPMIPHVIVLESGLVIYKIYNGYWFFGRPTLEDLRHDLSAVTKKCRPDWDITTPELSVNRTRSGVRVSKAGCRCAQLDASISIAHDEAAVDVDGLAGHIVGVAAGKKAHDAGHVLGSFRSAERDDRGSPFPRFANSPALDLTPLGVDFLPHRRVNRPRADAIRGDPIGREHLRGGAGNADNTGLAGAVMRHVPLTAAVGGDRGGLDQLSTQFGARNRRLLAHAIGGGLQHEKNGAQVDGQ